MNRETSSINGGRVSMDAKTFDRYCDYIYEKSGITLKEGKESLVSARIAKLMRARNIDDPGEYLDFVIADKTGMELVELLDAISTNLTYFFRESAHFDFLRDIIAQWHAKGQLSYRIWCAAASSGEEPYSIAMTLLDVLGEGRADIRILATDISTRMLQKCKEGIYDEERLKAVPGLMRERFFDRRRTSDGSVFSAGKSLRDTLFFRRLNLATPPFPMRGPMDVVFCRNVMIYFDNPVRINLVDEIYRLLKPGGYLLTGHSESLTGLPHSFKTVQPAVYLKK